MRNFRRLKNYLTGKRLKPWELGGRICSCWFTAAPGGYGQRILTEFLDYNGLSAKSEKAQAYLCAHDDALLWAKRNRELVEWLGFGSGVNLIADCVHNFLEEESGRYLHRKGAVSAKKGW